MNLSVSRGVVFAFTIPVPCRPLSYLPGDKGAVPHGPTGALYISLGPAVMAPPTLI